jgi:hypothetical protein
LSYFIALTVILISTHASAADKSKVSRKPANSSTIECVAFSAGDYISKLEIGAGNNPISRGVRVDGTLLQIQECAESDDCYYRSNDKFHAKFQDKELVFQVKFGKTLKKQETPRGGHEVNEIRPIVTHDGAEMKMFGVCSGYNY